ncbi:MAG: hypothetical protein B7Z66_06510 [Chromatiales bacterium 21-64-14]|nr:MAG: hypothetical protein B7Z66_06510 [Chromatiales bacterium 21-64-14]
MHPNQIQDWKKRLAEGAGEVFARSVQSGGKADETVQALHAKIGRLTMENDFSYGPVLSRGSTSFLTVSRALDCFMVNASHRIRNAANRLCIDDGSSSYSRIG